MVITYFGEAFVKLQFGDMVVAVNPINKSHNPKSSKFGADIALISQRSPVMNGVENVSFGSKEAFIIDTPGEYELSGVFIKGLASEGPHGLVNTIYTIMLEGMHIVHLGGLALPQLTPDTLEEISGADILILPIGGHDSLDVKTAVKLASSLEPKIIIPVLLGEKDENLKHFLKETDSEKVSPIEKLSIKRKDLEGKQSDVAVLSVS